MAKLKRFWCMGCGAYDKTRCDELGHVSQAVTDVTGKTPNRLYGSTTIAAKFLGRLEHLPVKVPA